MNHTHQPIGILDSGVGGLSILSEIRRLLPHEDILYFADQGHVPYGPRPAEEIQGFVRGIVRFFMERNARAIVLACNAASAAGLRHIREIYPEFPFVGMEPAVKPAAERTQRGVIGVITTRATYQGELYASVIDRFAGGIKVVTQVCPEFVLLVEAGQFDGAQVRKVAQEYLAPLLAENIDQLVLGCTHFPYLTPVLQDILGSTVEIIDPGPAVARQTVRILEATPSDAGRRGEVAYFTSGDVPRFTGLARHLIGDGFSDQDTHQAVWQSADLVTSD
jgi:glutamate racemase